MTIPNSDFMIENGVCDFPTTPEEEKRIVSELVTESEDNLKEGNLYFVISKRWYASWQKYVEQSKDECLSGESLEASRPGAIDNHDIIESESDDNDPQLRRLLVEGVDYVLVPQEVWKRLVEWYSGGPPIERKLICQGFYSRSYSVEVYPLCLMLTDGRDESRTTIRLGKQTSIRELCEKVCTMTGVAQEKAHIWDYFHKRKNGLLDPSSNKSLEESSLQMDQDILLEVDGSSSSQYAMSSAGNELALVPLEPSRSRVTIAGGPTLSNGHSTTSKFSLFPRITSEDDGCNSLSILGKGEKGGLAGLSNLGNTCFMNSALQCLAHTPPIVEYFLQDYSDDINRDNPLGMCGELAIAFGDLLKKLWSSRNAVAPRSFKTKLARFAPQFSGYNQHDSQELLAFLLDGLHEDLNKVKRKPYIELKDSDSRPDDEVAEELWNYHKARNDSVIVNVCQGQYKSTLVCPVCGKISITFDPFMYLSVPLPSTLTRSMTITVFYCDGSRLPMPYTVTVPKHGSCRDLITALGTACCLADDESLLLAEVYDHKIFRYFENPLDSLSAIKDDEHIVAYRLNQMPKGSGKAKLEILHGGLERDVLESVRGRDVKHFGTPLVTYVNTDPLSGTDIDAVISGFLSPLHRVHASSKIHNGSDNGHLADATADETSGSLSSPDTEIDDASDGQLSFRIFLTDERGLNFKPLQSESSVSPGTITRVLVEWNEGEHETYDSSYLSDLPEVHKTSFSAKKTRQEAISLFSCLEAFLAEEPLGPDDMWFCPSCKEHRQANKKLDLWKLPDILVFHLKRFTYSRYLKNKIDTFVNFPIQDLDLSKYVKNKNGQSYLYELYAVSNHYGGLGGGHYTAYAKLIDDNKWYHFDDSHVSSVNESEIKNSAAYVLFYRRVGSKTETQTAEMSRSDMD
ncbi:Peptidase C19 ubiquitin carboxyl-terminal hydrolase [Arabidopsis thaliana x Arabidopsis arenosa]|uniref:Ubiquitin carboxyl-terminal hydrolase n=1 Tax=Arabidopsis thaliana x Arabidopsis arenosa TaxID=1240361 RepID=A0A8T1Z321_9BRAS|nr:Peptidase C19 ubiquitin carboxyl-terminal hydrolase [Arabidopsis thaliana x Arabidopsis arenosa]